jgi:hypothetical protein
VGRSRRVSVKLPPHVHVVTARGKQYYYFHAYRGTDREEERVKLPGYPSNMDGTPNAEWWEVYRRCLGEPEKKKPWRALSLP